MSQVLRRTPLFDEHRALGARLVPFAGFEMPVQYAGILAEHQAVRQRAGLFDVSHMGEVEIRGTGALDLVQRLTTNDASRLDIGQAQYTAFLNERGGVIDDCIVYRFPDHYMIVVNASNQEKDLAWIRQHAADFDAVIVDRSEDTGLIALQGPAAHRPESGVIVYEGPVAWDRPAVLRYGASADDWARILPRLEQERARLRTRTGGG
jgi:aminomethyltransferase